MYIHTASLGGGVYALLYVIKEESRGTVRLGSAKLKKEKMTDSTPTNYYLIFNRSDEFETQDKIFYALKERDSIHRHHWNATLEEILRRKLLIHSLDELKRCIKRSRFNGESGKTDLQGEYSSYSDNADVLPLSPTSSSSSTSGVGSSEDEEVRANMNHPWDASPFVHSKAFPPPLSASGKPFEAVTTIDAKPWESAGANVREWHWPIEVLYQHYHVHVVIDFLRVFDVSRNGHVFYDRIPDVVQCLINSIETMLEHRMIEKKEISEWLPSSSNLSWEQQEKVLQQVWDPRVLLSITLINVPWHADGQVPHNKEDWKRYLKIAQGELRSPEMKNFSSCESTKSSIVPILTRADASKIVRDAEFHGCFIKKLARTLGEYEKASRGVPAAPETVLSLESSIEYLLRSAPNTSKYCESIILVTNLNTCSCSSAISSLEGMVHRKNIIFSIVTLNREPVLDSPQLSALTHFVSRIGGFVVNIDFWRSLAQPNLNAEWSKRFEGSRCLIQQLFVQLINRFPRASRAQCFARSREERVEVYQKTDTLTLTPNASHGDNIADAILKALAVARFNENWSVLMYSPRSVDEEAEEGNGEQRSQGSETRVRQLLARSTHYFHQGSLTLEYELSIALPYFERRVSVRGTKTLVYQFCRANEEARRRSSTTSNTYGPVGTAGGSSEAVTSLSQRGQVSYVENFCLHLREEILGEEVILLIMLKKIYSKELLHFSCASGVFYKWFNFAAVRSLAVCYDMSKRKDYSSTPSTSVDSKESPSRVVQCIEATLEKHNYVRIKDAEELAFIRQIDYQPYLVQLFPVGSNKEEPFKDYYAGCLECRISFFFWDWKKRSDVVREMINILLPSGISHPSPFPYRENDRVVLRAFSHKKSQCLLGAMQELTIPRLELPPVHLSKSSVLGTSGRALPMRIPHPSFPFALKQALTFHWHFSKEPNSPLELRKKCFFFSLLRRRQAFDCLVSFGDSLKAILQRKDGINDQGNESGGIELDHIDASGEHATVKVTRVITNVTTGCASLPGDVEQDFKIFSALRTFYNKVSSPVTSQQEKIEPLLPYLPSDMDILVLPSPKCFGPQGVVYLRHCLKRYLKSLDSTQTAESRVFPPSLVRSLQTSGGVTSTQQKERSFSMLVSTKVVVSPNPIQNGSIVFAIMIADDPRSKKDKHRNRCHDESNAKWSQSYFTSAHKKKEESKGFQKQEQKSEVGAVNSQLGVALLWMNYARLSQEITSHYRPDTSVHITRNERNAVQISNRRLVMHIRNALEVRASLHSTAFLLKYFSSIDKTLFTLGQQERHSLGEMEKGDLLEAVSHLTIFVDEIPSNSMTALYYVVESVVTSSVLERQNSGRTQESDIRGTVHRVLIHDVLSQLLMQFCKSYAPLLSLWFPRESVFEVLKDSLSLVDIPVLMKCALKESEKGNEKRTSWIPCPEPLPADRNIRSLADVRNTLKEYIGANGWADRTNRDKESQKPPLLRVFMLSSELEKDSGSSSSKSTVNPAPDLTSQLLKETPPELVFFSNGSNCIPLERVCGTHVGTKLQCLMETMQKELIRFCLEISFQHQSFVEMFRIIEEDEKTVDELDLSLSSTLSRVQARTENSKSFSCSASASAVVDKRFAVLRHPSIVGCGKVKGTEDLQRLLHQVVLPSLATIAPSSTRRDVIQDIRSYAYESTDNSSSSTSFSTDLPQDAIREMFMKFAKEDGIILLPIQNSRYFLVPPRAQDATGSIWIFVDVKILPETKIAEVVVEGYTVDSAKVSVTDTLCQALLEYIKKKMTQFCQLQLLKELRHTQYCSEELLPEKWGDQFRRSPGERKPGSQVSGTESAPSVSSLYLQGKTMLHLPLYYKLQNQSDRLLWRIAGQCPRLELVPIVNQPQCFLVADDNTEDVFHCLRFVLALDYTLQISTVDPSPTLGKTDRCLRLVIQLFSAVDNPAVQRPLEKLQRFCYFLAVQELHRHLNYVNALSFHDALFLQPHRREPLSIPCTAPFGSIHSTDVEDIKNMKGSGNLYGNTKTDGHLALFFVELYLREHNFKVFEVSGDRHNTTSKFLEYYDLQSTEEKDAEKLSSVSTNTMKEMKKKQQLHTRRFVKLTDKLNDVLVSCSVYIDVARQCVVVEPYCTKEPIERFTDEESEKYILEELKRCEADSRVLMQLYSRLQSHQKRVPLTALHSFLEDILQMSEKVSLTDYRFKKFSLEDISPTTLPFLVERLCAALALLKPCCFQYVEEDDTPSCHDSPFPSSSSWIHVPSFPWKWLEHVQNDPLADNTEFYIICGCQQVVMDSGLVVPPTRVLPYAIPDLPLGINKVADPRCRSTALSSLESQMVLKVSMATETLSIGFFNVPDVEVILSISSIIVEEMSFKTSLLQEVLLQRMGIKLFDSAFSELDLARHCCGDATNVIENRRLAIDPQLYRRPRKTLRFPPSSSNVITSSSDKAEIKAIFLLLLEWLHNRGIVVNHIFPFDDGVKVLFDESENLTIAECENLMRRFISIGFLRSEESAALQPQVVLSHKRSHITHSQAGRTKPIGNCRVTLKDSNRWAREAIIACSFHRHLFIAHIIIEAQNAQSSVQDLLSQCEPQLLQDVRDMKDENQLARTVVLLRSKSQEIFASRVPDFVLFPAFGNPADDVLEQTLPERSEEGLRHADAVDAVLREVTSHLTSVCPDAITIDLDPTCEGTLMDPVLVSRLRCRYGKVHVKEKGEVIRFCPHLHYAVIPLYTLLQAQVSRSPEPSLEMLLQEGSNFPISSCGLFVVEIGFQVSHYALDVFAIKGHLVSSSIVAHLAAELRQRLGFENVLYDHQVRQIIRQLRHPNTSGSTIFTAPQNISQEVSALLSVYPFPPMEAKTAAAAFYHDHDFLSIRMNFAVKETQDFTSCSPIHLLLLNDKGDDALISAATRQQYEYYGIAACSPSIMGSSSELGRTLSPHSHTPSPKACCLFILLRPLSEAVESSSFQGVFTPPPPEHLQQEEFYSLFSFAKNKLEALLLHTTHEEETEFAWRKFFRRPDFPLHQHPSTAILSFTYPSFKEYYLVLNDAVKLLLPHALERIRGLLECIDWPLFPEFLLIEVVKQFYPSVVLHIFPSVEGSSPWGRKGFQEAEMGSGGSTKNWSCSAVKRHRRSYGHTKPMVLALAHVGPVTQSFLVAEGWSTSYPLEHRYSMDVEEVSIIRRLPQSSDSPTKGGGHLCPVGVPCSCSMQVLLHESENELISLFQSILARGIWVTTMWDLQ